MPPPIRRMTRTDPELVAHRVELQMEEFEGLAVITGDGWNDETGDLVFGTSRLISRMVRDWLPDQDDSLILEALEADLKAALWELAEHRRALEAARDRRDDKVEQLELRLAREVLSKQQADPEGEELPAAPDETKPH